MRKNTYLIITIAGAVLLAFGTYLSKTTEQATTFFRALPYICIGIGAGLFGHGTGELITDKAMKNAPNLQKQMNIEKSDERNVMIIHHAKAKAYDLMTFVFGVLMISYALMGAETVYILLLVFAYLLVHAYGIYYRIKYNKEM